MAGFVVKNRRIVVDGEEYRCSVKEGAEGIELLIYREKRLLVRLRQNWVESWGINLYRPGAAAEVIRHYRGEPPGEPRILSQEPALFSALAELCFSAEEPEEKEWYLQACARMRARLESEAKTKPEGE